MSKVEITATFCKNTVKKTQADEYLEITNHVQPPKASWYPHFAKVGPKKNPNTLSSLQDFA